MTPDIWSDLFIMDSVTLYYNEEKNIMEDEEGYEIFNIFSIISPNMLYLFKQKREDMVVRGTNGILVELVYPYDEEC